MFESGSPNAPVGGTAQTFRAVFEMPVVPSNHNLIKIGKRQYRNPIYLAREWRQALDNGEYASPAALARQLKVSRERVSQILNLLKLDYKVQGKIVALGNPLTSRIVCERTLRPLVGLSIIEQKARIKRLLKKFYQAEGGF